MVKMKNVLIVYSKMVVGGSTTSLLSLLNGIDYSKYSVELQLYDNEGELQSQINKKVKILPEMKKQINFKSKVINYNFWRDFIKARVLSKRKKNRLINSQYMSKYEAEACPWMKKQYDVAISYLEFWPMEYLARRVNAEKKIGWLHIDIKEAGLLPKVSDEVFNKLDNIVLVSKACLENMKTLYPQCTDKLKCIENILVKDTIIKFANTETSFTYDKNSCISFVSVCRIVFASKGLDRAVNAFSKLKKEGLLNDNVHWYIIGDGPDRDRLEKMISINNLSKNIILLGQQNNPYVIEKNMDYFLLPSRYEGKPMAVTEAQMLGLVPLVCNYSSASEQIKNGIDGLICENDDISIYYVIKDILQNKINLSRMKKNVENTEYSNIDEIHKIYKLF